MIPIEKHAEEIFWLKRRIQYLEQIHLLSKRTYPETLIAKLTPHYSKVATPRHLVECIEEVYEGNLS
jgi:hypothetical protein